MLVPLASWVENHGTVGETKPHKDNVRFLHFFLVSRY